MSDLYDEDILLWSERQGDLLRRIAAGEPVNERPDWANIIEEVESVGREQLHAVESLLVQALVHMLKAEGWPLAAMSRIGEPMRAAFAHRRGDGSFPPCGRTSIWRACMPMRFGRFRQRWTASRRSLLLRYVR
jgi:hypothetical protein